MQFSRALDAYAQRRQVGIALLVHMDFRAEPRRWWMGFGDLRAGGEIWQGLGELIMIDGLSAATGTVAPVTTFTISGVDPEIVALARDGSEQVKGRRVRVYGQFLDLDGTAASETSWSVKWALLDEPFVVYSGVMDQLRFTADGPSDRTIVLTSESLWADRNRPPFGLYTNADQRQRYPGDAGLQWVPSLVSKTVRWPDFVLALAVGGAAWALASAGIPIA